MLALLTSPVTVVAYRQLEKPANEGGGPMTRRDGTIVEMIEFSAPGDYEQARPRQAALDSAINGSRPDVGEVVCLRISSPYEPQATRFADGRTGVKWVEKRTVVGFDKPAK